MKDDVYYQAIDDSGDIDSKLEKTDIDGFLDDDNDSAYSEDSVLESAFSIHSPPAIDDSESIIEPMIDDDATDDAGDLEDAHTHIDDANNDDVNNDDADKVALDTVEIAPLMQSESSGSSVQIPQSVLGSISVDVRVELGETHINLNQLYTLREGQILELDRELGDPLDVVVNGQVIAKCEIVSINYRYAIRIIELINTP